MGSIRPNGIIQIVLGECKMLVSASLAVASSAKSTSQDDGKEGGASGNNNKDESLDVLWKMINEDKQTINEDTMSILGDNDVDDTLSLLPDLDQDGLNEL